MQKLKGGLTFCNNLKSYLYLSIFFIR